MNLKGITVSLLPVLLLAGCYTAPQRPAEDQAGLRPDPAPVEQHKPAVEAATDNQEIQISAYEPASRPALTPLHSRAVESLLASAKQQERDRDLDGAVGTVERALGIEPRNAHLWHRLANLRFSQGRLSMASDLAVKSLALAGADVALKRENWELIARVRRATGDLSGAQVAERKARLLN